MPLSYYSDSASTFPIFPPFVWLLDLFASCFTHSQIKIGVCAPTFISITEAFFSYSIDCWSLYSAKGFNKPTLLLSLYKTVKKHWIAVLKSFTMLYYKVLHRAERMVPVFNLLLRFQFVHSIIQVRPYRSLSPSTDIILFFIHSPTSTVTQDGMGATGSTKKEMKDCYNR